MSSIFTSVEWKNFVNSAKKSSFKIDYPRILPANNLLVDFSTQVYSRSLSETTKILLNTLEFQKKREDLFSGNIVNFTEKKSACHTALRAKYPQKNFRTFIKEQHKKINLFCKEIEKSHFTSILYLGIGGSSWGVELFYDAFKNNFVTHKKIYFLSNIDGHSIYNTLHQLNPKNTLVIISSKSFTTIEPLINFNHVINWLKQSEVKNPFNQIACITSNVDAALTFGIYKKNTFEIPDCVGGRYSIWSSIGMVISLIFGFHIWQEFLDGGCAMDEHFFSSDYECNVPIQMAISGIINTSILNYASLAIIPYDLRLKNFIPWLQQLEMESLGKCIMQNGENVPVQISPVIWGLPGTDSQHTFFQWLHQHSTGAPIDFIVCLKPDHSYKENHRILFANCISQRIALYTGYREKTDSVLGIHKNLAGNRPSTLIALEKLTPYNLGSLMALYEHKVFVQGIVWDINPFDQWGVEYGKQLAQEISYKLENNNSETNSEDRLSSLWMELFRKKN